MGVKDEIYGAVVAEIKHAYMIWDAPPPEAIARAVLVVASKQLLDRLAGLKFYSNLNLF